MSSEVTRRFGSGIRSSAALLALNQSEVPNSWAMTMTATGLFKADSQAKSEFYGVAKKQLGSESNYSETIGVRVDLFFVNLQMAMCFTRDNSTLTLIQSD